MLTKSAGSSTHPASCEFVILDGFQVGAILTVRDDFQDRLGKIDPCL